MKKTSISLIFIIALTAFCIWVSNQSAQEDFYTKYYCSLCYSTAPVTCSGCHRHGTKDFTVTTNKLTYAPGESITVSITGETNDQPGWVRLILYDLDGKEVARSSGPSGQGGWPAFQVRQNSSQQHLWIPESIPYPLHDMAIRLREDPVLYRVPHRIMEK